MSWSSVYMAKEKRKGTLFGNDNDDNNNDNDNNDDNNNNNNNTAV